MAAQTDPVDARLQATWPNAACELDAATPWQLLVATVLSAQAADARVNAVMANLNEHLLDIHAYAKLDAATLAKLCRQVPLAKQKSERIIQAAHWLIHHHNGDVPMEPQALQAVPGVGAKVPQSLQAMPSVCRPSPPIGMSCGFAIAWAGVTRSRKASNQGHGRTPTAASLGPRLSPNDSPGPTRLPPGQPPWCSRCPLGRRLPQTRRRISSIVHHSLSIKTKTPERAKESTIHDCSPA